MKKIAVAVLVGLALGSIGVANAAAGDSTVSIGYAQIHSKGLKKAVDYYGGALNSASDFVDDMAGNTGVTVPDSVFSAGADKYKDPKGVNLKYRYEFDDNWGVIGSFTYAWEKYDGHINANDPSDGDSVNAKGSIKGNYFSLLAGPAYRINDYVSGYAMIGLANSKIKYSADYAYKAGGSMGSGSYSEDRNKTSFAYGVGLQFNPFKNIAIDVAYEGSGSGDWNTNGFNVGVGYSF
ncbi:Ail/Lom family outer membrane beta-barrel protein [Salmonella enterica]|nr:Ail/Lom family outer membrane beta-barrel protein [Salmonella enterica]EJU2684561.1 Ail/Lom family outer membrane beta-barrel protein [Salmonella enterica]EJX3842635.1 Ail/Lom family outer membrane beta-barrel protein [Salmonella enterica]EJX4248733.1 Ail/Lom family outer membrane beta-barrel protein [Salmonella enterica]EJX4537968.1 Ail/Lom family outer membrane beta-barrel protein [Salmonella enterica]